MVSFRRWSFSPAGTSRRISDDTLHVCSLASRSQTPPLLFPDACAVFSTGRRIRRARRAAAVHYVGSRTHSRLPTRLDLGWSEAPGCRAEVLSIYRSRFYIYFGCWSSNGILRRQRDLRYGRTRLEGLPACVRTAALCRIVGCIWCQTSCFPPAHVAARCTRRGIFSRIDDISGRTAEDGRIRVDSPKFR